MTQRVVNSLREKYTLLHAELKHVVQCYYAATNNYERMVYSCTAHELNLEMTAIWFSLYGVAP